MGAKHVYIASVTLFAVRLFAAAVLAFGAFMGQPSDPIMSGIFWTFTALSVILAGVDWQNEPAKDKSTYIR